MFRLQKTAFPIMNLFLILFGLASLCLVSSKVNSRKKSWNQFKIDFNKTYEDAAQEQRREKIFVESLKTIAYHNLKFRRGKVSFKMGINQFADMSLDEYRKAYVPTEDTIEEAEKIILKLAKPVASYSEDDVCEPLDIPESFDWRDQGAVTKVNDQLSCGSCYAMASLGALESRWFLKTGVLTELSVQEIVDCSDSYHNYRCEGGISFQVLEYVKDFGISSAESYLYVGIDGECQRKKNKIFFDLEGFGVVRSSQNFVLLKVLATDGPLAIFLDLSHETFMRYSGGIYYEPRCSSETNHAALLVGYGSEEGQDYWIIKNSFGTKWGEGGYMKIARNLDNDCGIKSLPIYPVFTTTSSEELQKDELLCRKTFK